MSDADAAELKAEAGQRHRIAVERMRRRWHAAGYDPRAHLRTITAEGDRGVLLDFIRQEGDRRMLASWLASRDAYEIVDEIWRRERRLRQAAGDRG